MLNFSPPESSQTTCIFKTSEFVYKEFIRSKALGAAPEALVYREEKIMESHSRHGKDAGKHPFTAKRVSAKTTYVYVLHLCLCFASSSKA